MATEITRFQPSSGGAGAVKGGTEQRIVRAPSGLLFACLTVAGTTGTVAKFYWSSDDGLTWHYSGSSSDVALGLNSWTASLFIDADGYAHLSYCRRAGGAGGGEAVGYSRGTPLAYGTQFSWKHLSIPTAQGFTEWDSDVLAYRAGSGWKAWVAYIVTKNSGGLPLRQVALARVAVSSSGGLSVEASDILVPGLTNNTTGTPNAAVIPEVSIDFRHNGDGRTPTSTPHIYVFGAWLADAGGTPGQPGLWRYRYDAGNYVMEAKRTLIAETIDNAHSLHRGHWDGSRAVLGLATHDTPATDVRMIDWLESTDTITARNPTDPGSLGEIRGLSMAHDPDTHDVWLVCYGATNTTPRWNHLVRATNTWTGWTALSSAENVLSSTYDGRVSLVRHVGRSSVDLLYQVGTDSGVTYVRHHRIDTVNHTPTAPALVRPTPGKVADLNAGYRFEWNFTDPDPGDSQSAWQFRRRVVAAGTFDYWNAATGAWTADSTVWNAGGAEELTFLPTKWANGQDWLWSVRTRDSLALTSPWAVENLVRASTAPQADIVTPAGVLYDDAAPIVTWLATGPNPQRTYQVKVWDQATYLGVGFDPVTSTTYWDSGELAGIVTRALRLGLPLDNLATYVIGVRISDSLGAYSAWDYSEVTLDLQPAAPPALELLPEVFYGTGVERVRMTILGRSNVLDAATASAEAAGDTSGWTNEANATIGTAQGGAVGGNYFTLTPTVSGTNMRLVTAPGDPPPTPIGEAPVTGPLEFPVYGGQQMTALASFTTLGAPRSCRVGIRWLNAADTTISTDWAAPVADQPGQWLQAAVTAEAPGLAVRARLVVEVNGNPAEIHGLDAISLHPGPVQEYQPGGRATGQTFRVVRTVTDADGVDVDEVVRTAQLVVPDMYQRATAYDREMPYAAQLRYHAFTDAHPLAELTLPSDPSAESVAEVTTGLWALRDVYDDDAEAQVLVTKAPVAPTEAHTIYRPSGRSAPVVETEGVGLDDGDLTIQARSRAERERIMGLVKRTSILVAQSPGGTRRYLKVYDRNYDPSEGVLGFEISASYVAVPMPT